MLKELSDNSVGIASLSCNVKNNGAAKSDYFYDKFVHDKPQTINLNEDLVKLCCSINKPNQNEANNGYHRLVFFVAIVSCYI